jgi:hypothetical protein
MATDLENLKARLLKISSKDSPKPNLPQRKPKIQITPQKPVQFPLDETEMDDDEDFPTEEEELAQPQEDIIEEQYDESLGEQPQEDIIEELEEPAQKVPMRSPVRAIPQISRKPQFVNTQPQVKQPVQQQSQQPIRQPIQKPIQQPVRQPLQRPVQQQPMQQQYEPQQPSQEDIESFQQQMLHEQVRLGDGAFKVEILFQFNRLNNNIEALIKALSESE